MATVSNDASSAPAPNKVIQFWEKPDYVVCDNVEVLLTWIAKHKNNEHICLHADEVALLAAMDRKYYKHARGLAVALPDGRAIFSSCRWDEGHMMGYVRSTKYFLADKKCDALFHDAADKPREKSGIYAYLQFHPMLDYCNVRDGNHLYVQVCMHFDVITPIADPGKAAFAAARAWLDREEKRYHKEAAALGVELSK